MHLDAFVDSFGAILPMTRITTTIKNTVRSSQTDHSEPVVFCITVDSPSTCYVWCFQNKKHRVGVGLKLGRLTRFAMTFCHDSFWDTKSSPKQQKTSRKWGAQPVGRVLRWSFRCLQSLWLAKLSKPFFDIRNPPTNILVYQGLSIFGCLIQIQKRYIFCQA